MQNNNCFKDNEEEEANIICKLCKLKGYSELVEILKLIASTPNLVFLKREYKKGVKVLMNAMRFLDVYEILEIGFRNGKKTEENFVISILIALPTILQAKLVSSIVNYKVCFEPFFFSKLIDSLVIDGQIISAINIFFVFSFNQTAFLPDINQFIERLFAQDHPYLLTFFRLFNTKYLSNCNIYEVDLDASATSVVPSSYISDELDSESDIDDLSFNIDQYLSQFDINAESIIDTSAYCGQTQLEQDFDASFLTCDVELMRTQTNKIYSEIDQDFIKNLKLEAEISNKLISEFTKKL